jgi:hypothetical protein
MIRKTNNNDRVFLIHAGTHKTATTYIQSRILANFNRLSSLGVYSGCPASKERKWKPLVASLQDHRWSDWLAYINRIPSHCESVLVSAEQFTQPLSKPANFEALSQLLSDNQFRLKVVVFLRDQPDYMNARFVHSTRRLYHCTPFPEYVDQQMQEGAKYFDYGFLFKNLMDSADIDIKFLPYGFSFGDPFERLMQHCGWVSPRGWKSADPASGNVQPGCKGIWLAQQTYLRLSSDASLGGMKLSSLRGSGGVIRRISEREGWTAERYFGFCQSSYDRVAGHYRVSNEQFAQRIWGQSWDQIFPSIQVRERVYESPSRGSEHDKMLALVDEAVQAIKSKQ